MVLDTPAQPQLPFHTWLLIVFLMTPLLVLIYEIFLPNYQLSSRQCCIIPTELIRDRIIDVTSKRSH